MKKYQILFIFKVFLKLNGCKSDDFRFFRSLPSMAYSSSSMDNKFGRSSSNNHMNIEYIHLSLISNDDKKIPTFKSNVMN